MMSKRAGKDGFKRFLLILLPGVLGVVITGLAGRPLTGQEIVTGMGDGANPEEESLSLAPGDLMPLHNQTGYYLLSDDRDETPRELPFSITKVGPDRYDFEKQNRVRHHLVHTENRIKLTAEVDLKDHRRIEYDPPVLLLPPETPSERSKWEGTSSMELFDARTGRKTDEGECRWTLSYVGREEERLFVEAEQRVYRYRLIRKINLGTFKKTTLTVTFDYLPGQGQVRARVMNDARVQGLIGPKEEWTITRVEQIRPRYHPGDLFRETHSVLLRRYRRAVRALTGHDKNRANRYIEQFSHVLSRMDHSLLDLDEAPRSKVKELYESLEKRVRKFLETGDLDQKRERFRNLSDRLLELIEITGHDGEEPVRYLQCAKRNEHRWLSTDGHGVCPFSRETGTSAPEGYPIRYIQGSR